MKIILYYIVQSLSNADGGIMIYLMWTHIPVIIQFKKIANPSDNPIRIFFLIQQILQQQEGSVSWKPALI